MIVHLHADFKKQFKKLRPAQKAQFTSRRDLFMVNPFHPILRNHQLHGHHEGCRSINIGGDLRVVYRMINEDVAYFIAIGTHSQLYE